MKLQSKGNIVTVFGDGINGCSSPALVMAFSSVSVVTNSLLMKRYKSRLINNL